MIAEFKVNLPLIKDGLIDSYFSSKDKVSHFILALIVASITSITTGVVAATAGNPFLALVIFLGVFFIVMGTSYVLTKGGEAAAKAAGSPALEELKELENNLSTLQNIIKNVEEGSNKSALRSLNFYDRNTSQTSSKNSSNVTPVTCSV